MEFSTYLSDLEKTRKSGQATEPSYYPALKSLLLTLDSSLNVVINPKRTEHGSPDFSVKRRGRVEDPQVGWIEAKDIDSDLDQIEKTDQLKRYLEFPNLVLTNFVEFRWYHRGKACAVARLAAVARGHLRGKADGENAVRDLLQRFLRENSPRARDPKELAWGMARWAHFIRNTILQTYKAESEGGKLHRDLGAFRETLIPDLSPEQFADMYAQTIAYGLFAARCQKGVTRDNFSRERAAYLIPRTNPFLRKLFETIAGADLPEDLRPEVEELADVLGHADLNNVLADFGKRTAREDPVVHFYEDFLKEYDPKVRKMRGVYYTPEPVVSYIVRSVDHLLKTKFNKPDGLADKDVLILDPACGTGTFLYYVIQHIHRTLQQKGQAGRWNSYVSESLLPRVFGFELLMAPYAMAHLKLGLLLQELGYQFDTDERLGVYLTNTLEEAIKKSEAMFAQWIADEANAAADIKRDKPIMVVLGNPPYSGHSANRSWVMKNGKKELTFIGRLLQDYYKVDGKPLGERNPKWLQDDYVKFIRFGQWRIERTGHGILAFITNHGYLDNPTFRGMRQQLMRTFPEIHILDLHGNAKKKERAPDGSKDENVFDIQQGVAIGLYVKEEQATGPANVQQADLWGERETKYEALSEADVEETQCGHPQPKSPAYLFVSQDTNLLEEYETGLAITDVMPLNAIAMNSHRDGFAIGFDASTLRDRIEELISPNLPDEEIRAKYELTDTSDFSLEKVRRELRKMTRPDDIIIPCVYRPLDFRFVMFHPDILDRPRPELNSHFVGQSNLGLVTTRQTREPFAALVVNKVCGQHKIVAQYDGSSVFPLYTYPRKALPLSPPSLSTGAREDRHPNISATFLFELEKKLNYRALTEGAGDLRVTCGPEDTFHYFYAVLSSEAYRERYLSFLKTNFPRVPLTSDKHLFAALAAKGAELASLHLMESPRLADSITSYPVNGNHAVEKVRYDERHKRVYINKTQHFQDVPKRVWEFQIGGYQVCERWLKDRKGRKLSSDDIDHYQKIVVALSETIRLMKEIDEIIPGWPLP